MSGTVFVDTNVLVYVRDRTDEEKQRRAAEWMAALWDSRLGRLSVQVLQEYYITLTRKLSPPRTAEEAREDVIALGVWRPATIDLGTLELAWEIQDRFALSWWDSLIVAAAVEMRCRHLLTEDLQDGQVVGGVAILNPFLHAPGEVLG
ncbi:MAG: PIN domain-containing protein [Longimicrobiales bacterium]